MFTAENSGQSRIQSWMFDLEGDGLIGCVPIEDMDQTALRWKIAKDLKLPHYNSND